MTYKLDGRLFGHAQVRGERAEFAEKLLCLFVIERWMYDYVIALLPVGGGGHILRAELERIDDSDDFIKISSGARGVDNNESDLFVGVDDIHRAHGEGLAGAIVDVGLVEHAVEDCHLALGVCDDGEVDHDVVHCIDILDPSMVVSDGVDADGNDFHVALMELRLNAG